MFRISLTEAYLNLATVSHCAASQTANMQDPFPGHDAPASQLLGLCSGRGRFCLTWILLVLFLPAIWACFFPVLFFIYLCHGFCCFLLSQPSSGEKRTVRDFFMDKSHASISQERQSPTKILTYETQQPQPLQPLARACA